MPKDSAKKAIKATCAAHTDLYLFEAIAKLAESSDISPDGYRYAQRIIKICRDAGQNSLRRYDRATDKVLAPKRKPSKALCEDCPPVEYPTDKTRCLPCPRRAALTTPERTGD